MRRRKKRKKLILLFCLFLVIGIVFAYNTSNDVFTNIFVTNSYGAQTIETFESPTDWMPGDETPKTVTIQNTGSYCEKVRVSYTESWKDGNNQSLPLEFEQGKRVVILNLDNNDDWVYSDGYYYYNNDLLSGETTNSFIRSVTFNPEYDGDISCTTVDNITKCNPSSSSYLGGSYELVFTVETIQCDAVTEDWNIN